MTKYKEEFEDCESLEVIERPNDTEQFEEDIKNSKDGELLERDVNFGRWAIFKEDGTRAGEPCKVLKICFYPSQFIEGFNPDEEI